MADQFGPEIQSPDAIPDDAPLSGGVLDLDSHDIHELAICLEEEFGVLAPEGRAVGPAFRTISSLARYVARETASAPVPRAAAVEYAARHASVPGPVGRFAHISFA